MSQQNPPPVFLTCTGEIPEKVQAIMALNEGLEQQLEAGGTDVGYWFARMKQMLHIIAQSPATEISTSLDPMVGAALQAMTLIGPALEKSLSNRDLLPACTCGNCEKSDIIDSIH